MSLSGRVFLTLLPTTIPTFGVGANALTLGPRLQKLNPGQLSGLIRAAPNLIRERNNPRR
jgi:hypothetical protein